nr:MAG TPA_asm: hypothetical protein [Bacteriophage sp.]DAT27280.1 MAG TPA: hypothetical protein [Caudoviricetes sp.]
MCQSCMLHSLYYLVLEFRRLYLLQVRYHYQ